MALLTNLNFFGFLSAVILLSLLVLSEQAVRVAKRQIFVLLIDGMRWDYVERMHRQDHFGFANFIEDGVRAEYVNTVFPSLTYPAWMTLRTGLYPESHNVLGNVVYDGGVPYRSVNIINLPMLQQNGVPIELTAARNNLRVATLNWIDIYTLPNKSLVPIEVLPVSSSLEEQIESVIQALMKGFDLVMMYYVKVDQLGHQFGPDSAQVLTEVRHVAIALDTLFSFIDSKGSDNGVHVMVVSDHGFAPCKVYPWINFSKYINVKSETERIVNEGAVVGVFAKRGRRRKLFKKLKKVPHYSTYLKRDIPEKYHYKGGVYAPDILMVGKPDTFNTSLFPRVCGWHGYDPINVPAMRTVFLGWGEAFVGGGFVNPPLHLVDIYQLYGHILGLPLQPHNGSWGAVSRMLTAGASLADFLKPHLLCFILFCSILFKNIQIALLSV